MSERNSETFGGVSSVAQIPMAHESTPLEEEARFPRTRFPFVFESDIPKQLEPTTSMSLRKVQRLRAVQHSEYNEQRPFPGGRGGRKFKFLWNITAENLVSWIKIAAHAIK